MWVDFCFCLHSRDQKHSRFDRFPCILECCFFFLFFAFYSVCVCVGGSSRSVLIMICSNLAHHENHTDTNNLTIEFNWRLRNNPSKNYVCYFILQERKKCYLNIKKQDITMIKTLKLWVVVVVVAACPREHATFWMVVCLIFYSRSTIKNYCC